MKTTTCLSPAYPYRIPLVLLVAAALAAAGPLTLGGGGAFPTPLSAPPRATGDAWVEGLVSPAPLDCTLCHNDRHTQWAGSAHARTQSDVASELGNSDAGLTPAAVIQAEDCLGCHAPTAVLANGGMSESQALGYFFSTSNGVFSAATTGLNTNEWPHVGCTTCHQVPGDHPTNAATLAYFNSQSGQYVPMTSASQLCGQCHGNLHFAGTDHQLENGWAMSKHANTQAAVAGELSASHPGETPDAVAQGEDCVGCHAPTAVLANGGMTEAQALGYFFSLTNGVFTTNTAVAHTNEWPHVACNACHDPHDPGKFSYFNSATKQYQVMTDSAQLCGQCHGNLRFAHTDHLSYNVITGPGGVGVTNPGWMAGGVTCVDCHMYNSGVDGSESKMLAGHTWAVTVQEAGGGSTCACTACHSSMDTGTAASLIAGWQGTFQTLDATVSASVATVSAACANVTNTNVLARLNEARQNLALAESDESQGVHNHDFLIALLNDASQKALSIPMLNVAQSGTNVVISWNGPGTLQSTPTVGGAWQDVPGAANPLVVPAATLIQGQFYRLRP